MSDANRHSTSRNHISLDTGPDKGNHYDQICALSVQTINDNFEALWKFRPEEVTELVFNDGENGVMTAFMLAPRIMIDPNQNMATNPVLHFSLRFDKNSNIFFNPKRVDMSGWVVTVTASLAELCVTPVEKESEDTLIDKHLALGPMKKIYELVAKGKDGKDEKQDLGQPIAPGQYGIHRLFAAISGSSWGRPEWKYSTMPNPKAGEPPISLETWKKADTTNLQLMNKITKTLEAWANMNQHSAFFTLGYQFKDPVPDKMKPEKKASQIAVPFDTRLVAYPYVDPDSYDFQLRRNPNVTPSGDIWEDYNCLVYAETTNRRVLPKRKLISYTGNLASPVNRLNPKEFRGTFVLDHRTFFRSQILVLLQEMCMGTMIVAQRPLLTRAGGISAQFSIGVAPPKSEDLAPGKLSGKFPAILASDEYYEFKLVGERKYEWKDNWIAPGSKEETYEHWYHSSWPFYRHWNVTSKAAVTVEWQPGGHEITVSGAAEYYHWQAQSSRSSFPFVDMDPSVGHYGDYWINSSWSFKIDLRVPQTVDDNGQAVLDYGMIEPTVEGLITDENHINYGLPADVKIAARNRYDISKGYEGPLNKIRESLRERLQHLIKSLNAGFRSAGRFVYPATGTFKFGSPMLANNGDVYADVDYLPPKLGGLITLRRPDEMKFTDPLYKKPDSATFPIPDDPTVRPDLMHLAWEITPESYDPETNRLRLTLRATNPSTARVAFQRVEISMLLVQVGGPGENARLFEDGAEFWEEWKPNPPAETKQPSKEDQPSRQENKSEGPQQPNVAKQADGSAEPKQPSKEEEQLSPAESKQPNQEQDPLSPTEIKQPNKQEDQLSPQEPKQPATVLEQAGSSDEPGEPLSEKPKEAEESPEPEEEDDEPSSTYLLSVEQIPHGLNLEHAVSGAGHLDFKLSPREKFKRPRQPRFFMDMDSKLALTLDGVTPGPGTYAVQIRETWESPNMYEKYPNNLWSDAFYTVTLFEDQKPEVLFATSAEVAKLQGRSEEK